MDKHIGNKNNKRFYYTNSTNYLYNDDYSDDSVLSLWAADLEDMHSDITQIIYWSTIQGVDPKVNGAPNNCMINYHPTYNTSKIFELSMKQQAKFADMVVRGVVTFCKHMNNGDYLDKLLFSHKPDDILPLNCTSIGNTAYLALYSGDEQTKRLCINLLVNTAKKYKN